MRLLSRSKRTSIWGLALALTLAGVGLGALAATSGIVGDNPAVVQEPLLLSTKADDGVVVLSDGTSNPLVIFADDTGFAGAAETFPGDSYAIKLLLRNASNADVVQRLTLTSPDGFRFKVAGGTNISVSQEKANTFLVRVGKVANFQGTLDPINLGGGLEIDELRITVQVGTEVLPGFFRIRIDMSQLLPTLEDGGA